MNRNILKFFVFFISIWMASCKEKITEIKVNPFNDSSLSHREDEIARASDDLDLATESIRIESNQIPLSETSSNPVSLVDLSWSDTSQDLVSSRFDCRGAKQAALLAHEVYSVASQDEPVENRIQGDRAENLVVFNARTGGRNQTLSPRGFVEFIPSDLERALENTPDDLPIDFGSLNSRRDWVLVFKGTEGGFSGSDWLTNRDMKAAPASRMHPDAKGVIHRGFLKTYLSAQAELREYFEDVFARKNQRLAVLLENKLVRSGLYTRASIDRYMAAVLENYRILITGHSLGGALATLAAYDFSLYFESFRQKLSLITFAAPASLYGFDENGSLYQFSHLIAQGGGGGRPHSAVFFERDGDIVHEDTGQENYSRWAPLRRFFYHGNAASFSGRPENSGLRVRIDPVPTRGILDRTLGAFLRTVTVNMLNPSFFAAHSMDGYLDDIHSYCDEMDHLQKCLSFELLNESEQGQCLRYGMDSEKSMRFLRELQDQGKAHIMDHSGFERIPYHTQTR